MTTKGMKFLNRKSPPPFSEEHIKNLKAKWAEPGYKEYMKKIHKGQKPWNTGKKRPEISGKNNYFYKGGKAKCIDCGKLLSTYDGLRCIPCRRKFMKGDKCWNYKGGITPLIMKIRNCFEYRQWRSDVFTRDDFICQLCGIRGGKLEADHYPKLFSEIFHENKIKTFDEALNCEELWNINNGRTLCKKCHRPFLFR